MFVHRSSGVNGSRVTASSRTGLEREGLRLAVPRAVRRSLAIDAVLVVLVLAASVALLRGPSHNQGFTVDESRWIATSRYFWITFVDRDLFGPAWQPNYLVYTHPPLARYLIGFGLWLQGWSPDQLNGRYDSLQGRAANERAGNVPDLDLLWAARRVTLVFAVAAMVLLYVVGRMLGGPLAGLAAVAVALANPLLTTVWTRALAESILAAFSLLALASAMPVMTRVGALGRLAWLPLVTGVALALAVATKLNGVIGALGLGAFAAIQQVQALLKTRRTLGLRSWVDVALASIILFVAVNPLLYVNPVDRFVGLIQHRQDEMQFQRSVFTIQAVPEDLQSRVARVAWRTFETYATPRGPLPISPDTLLVPIGVGVLLWRSIAELRRGQAGASLLFLCCLGTTYVIVTPNLGFDSSHYFAPLVTLNMVVVGVAGGAAAQWAVRHIGALAARRREGHTLRPGQNVQAPTM